MILPPPYHGFEYCSCVCLCPPLFCPFSCSYSFSFFNYYYCYSVLIFLYKKMYKQLTSNFQELQSLPLRNSEEFWKTLIIKLYMFSSFKTFTSNPQGLGYGPSLACFFFLFFFVVRIVFTAASSVINDGVFVKYTWNSLQKVCFHSLTEMDGNNKRGREEGGLKRRFILKD